RCPRWPGNQGGQGKGGPGRGKTMNRESADALESNHLNIAPIELDDFRRPPRQIPVAAEAAKSRFLGASNNNIRADPIFTVSDRYILSSFLAADGRDRAIRVFFDPHNTGLPLGLIDDRHLTYTEELTD